VQAKETKMMKQKLTLITGIILILTFSSFGQGNLARIIDKDGFTYLRNGQSINSAIIDTVYKNDFFYCVPSSNSDWFEVTEIKWDKTGFPIKGFMHKSRIQLIDRLGVNDKIFLIENVFKNFKNLGNELNEFVLKQTYNEKNKTWNSKKDYLHFKDIYKRNNEYSEKFFTPILKDFSDYFCETKDIKTLDLFVKTLWVHKGSANEMLSITLGECFRCEPELVRKQIQLIENKDELDLMINHIDWGLKNLLWTEKDGDNEPSSQDYLDLMKQLKSIKR